jgi:hypothetical protein
MRSVKEYVQVEYLGEKQLVPVSQYVCYASNLDLDAAGLHELYKQRSVSEFCDERDQSKLVLNWRAKKQNLQSETWIEQVKGHVMAGSTLTDDFWANDILWQLNVLAYNLSVMMRQKKIKFKKQEHRTFIDWFIAVPAKITSSGHQIESTIANANKNKQFSEQLKMYEHHFYKSDWEELDRLIEAA